MKKTIFPGALRGTVAAPPSKSELHRLLICASLCAGPTEIVCPVPPADILATAACLRSLGAELCFENGSYYVNHIAPRSAAVSDCGESGSTLRFLLPLAAALGTKTEFRCHGLLADRPMAPIIGVLSRNGCNISRNGDSFFLSGQLCPGTYMLDGSVSSQFLSGLLMAMPLLPDSRVLLSTPLVSEYYVDLTRAVLRRFGMEVTEGRSGYRLSGELRSPGICVPEGDWSAAAFWLVANALGSEVSVTGLRPDSTQGDRAVGAHIAALQRGGAVIDCTSIPDLVPPLAVLAAVTEGETRFVHAERLRGKESDRLRSVTALLCALGGDCREIPDGLYVRGKVRLSGGTADCRGDHRIAMAAAVAATVCTGPVTLTDAACVEKSYPAFWNDFEILGGRTL